MATMATTSHGLSVYVNSCIKNPLDPRTGQSISFVERSSKPSRLLVTDPGPDRSTGDYFGESGEFNSYAVPATVQASIEEVESQLKNLTDEQFYVKLQQLKDANRKTLEECEKLYKQKYGADDDGFETRSAKEMVENMFAARLAERTAERSRHVGDTAADGEREARANKFAPSSRDIVKDFSAKPPPVPYANKSGGPVRSTTLPQHSAAIRQRPSSAPVSGRLQRRAFSLDDEDWRRAMRASSDVSDEDEEDEEMHDEELVSAISRIENMWQGFRVEEYTSKTVPPANQRKMKDEKKDEWRHRITVPKPFQMTLREEIKEKKKTKAQIELEERRLQKQREEEAECQKKFQAQPAPAHIYLPLYDEIKEKNEARRKYIREYTKQIMLSTMKPFRFDKRESEKKARRRPSVAEQILQNQEQLRQKDENMFKARPVPQSVYKSKDYERQMEEQEFRKIRKKLRARELLEKSSLPPNMALLQKQKEEKERQALLNARKETRKQRTKSAGRVPDHDGLYRDFYRELVRKKKEQGGTVVEPFLLDEIRRRSLGGGRPSSARDRALEPDNRWPFQRSSMKDHSKLRGSLPVSCSLDSIPIKLTAASEQRSNAVRMFKEREMQKRDQEMEEERRREIRKTKLRKYISERSEEKPPDHYIKDRLKQQKKQEREQLERYQQELEEMKNRVNNRPLLFEQETQASAGKAAEKKFKSTLKNAGLDEEFVTNNSARARRSYSDDDQESGDMTYTRTALQEEELA